MTRIAVLQMTASIDPADIGMLVVGNMMSGILAQQQQLGALFADVAGLRGIEAACSLTLQQLARLQREDAERVLGFARASHSDGHAILALARAVATAGQARS